MIPQPLLDSILQRAFEEDLAAGDLTTEACVARETMAVATAVVRRPLVACGAFVFRRVFELLDPSIAFEQLVAEGEELAVGAPMWRVRGRAQVLLMGERTALNFTQRMSGVASAARAFMKALPAGSRTRITDTRKTTPGLRVLERYAVRTGGAHNHRDSLGSAVLIKDNHIIAAGGITAAIERARERAPHLSRIECEVASLVEFDEAVAARADVVMLDNFAMADVHEAVRRAGALGAARPLLEVSGGITFVHIAELGAAGVDLISIGAALTHSAPGADIALDLALG